MIGRGDLAGAKEYVDRALAEGPPSALYDARLAAVELAVAQGDPDSYRLATEGLSLAETGAHCLSVPRLAELIRQLEQGGFGADPAEG